MASQQASKQANEWAREREKEGGRESRGESVLYMNVYDFWSHTQTHSQLFTPKKIDIWLFHFCRSFYFEVISLETLNRWSEKNLKQQKFHSKKKLFRCFTHTPGVKNDSPSKIKPKIRRKIKISFTKMTLHSKRKMFIYFFDSGAGWFFFFSSFCQIIRLSFFNCFYFLFCSILSSIGLLLFFILLISSIFSATLHCLM